MGKRNTVRKMFSLLPEDVKTLEEESRISDRTYSSIVRRGIQLVKERRLEIDTTIGKKGFEKNTMIHHKTKE